MDKNKSVHKDQMEEVSNPLQLEESGRKTEDTTDGEIQLSTHVLTAPL